MNTFLKTQNRRQIYRAWLYSVVFSSKLSASVILLLLLSFFIQPFHRALANEALPEEIMEPEPVAEDVKIQPEEPVIEPEDDLMSSESEAVLDEILVEPTVATKDDEADVLSETEPDTTDDARAEFIESPPNLPLETEELDVEIVTSSEIESDIPTEDPPSATSSPPTIIDVLPMSVHSNLSDLPDSASVDSGSSTVNGTSPPEGEVLGETTTASTAAGVVVEALASSTTSGSSSPYNSGGSDDRGDGDFNDLAEDFVVEGGESFDDLDSESEPEAGIDIPPDEATEVTPDANSGPASSDKTEILSVLASLTAGSTTVESNPEVVTQAEYLVTEENYYQFSRQSCVAVGDGTYHCSLDIKKPIDENTVLYADKDAGGDMEIYIKTSGDKIEKLTDNDYDDTAPHLDADSMQVVWQRMIDGRYQIILYDLNEREETQLTFSRTNNMEPKVSSEGIVWQAWDDNDWEVMFFGGVYTDQITDNDTQDVAPVIEDGYILWSIIGSSGQEAQVYSLENGQIMTIAGHEGGSIENPRFVLVYDTKFDNGDIVTKSFDPDTGLSSQISAKPYSEPVKIPAVDTTGEIKALINNKLTSKEESAGDESKLDVDVLPTLDSVVSSATSSDTLDLKSDLTQLELPVTETVSTSVVETPLLELTEFDLVIASTTADNGTVDVSTSSVHSTSSTQE